MRVGQRGEETQKKKKARSHLTRIRRKFVFKGEQFVAYFGLLPGKKAAKKGECRSEE